MKHIFLNWKQNGDLTEIVNFSNNLVKSNFNVVLFPPAVYLQFASNKTLLSGGQNVSAYSEGAYTGEVGAKQLAEVGAKYCLVGHSERRQIFKEDDALAAKKVDLLLQNDITPILCIGESLEERKNGTIFSKLKTQMESFQAGTIIAYEPIWAIGTGLTASAQEVEEVGNFIFKEYGIEIIYGGSVNEKNSSELLAIKNINGLLIGGASLNLQSVNTILQKF